MIDRMKHGLGLVAVCSGMLVLSGCDQIGNPLDAITGESKAPDEFQVVARKPLRMPAGVNLTNLPEPRLGEKSPLEPDPNADAARVLLGANPTGAAGTSASEDALITAARKKTGGAAVTQEDIDRLEAEQPEDIPTLTELLSSSSDTEEVQDPLNADAEAQRLQAEGVAPAPVNPAPVPVEE